MFNNPSWLVKSWKEIRRELSSAMMVEARLVESAEERSFSTITTKIPNAFENAQQMLFLTALSAKLFDRSVCTHSRCRLNVGDGVPSYDAPVSLWILLLSRKDPNNCPLFQTNIVSLDSSYSSVQIGGYVQCWRAISQISTFVMMEIHDKLQAHCYLWLHQNTKSHGGGGTGPIIPIGAHPRWQAKLLHDIYETG